MGNQCEFLSVLGNLLWSPWHFKNTEILGTHRCVGSQACVGSVCVDVPWPGPAPWRSGFPVLQFFLQDRASEEEPVAGWWLAAFKLKANLGWWALAPYISSLKETWDVLDHLSSGHWYIETAHLPWQLGRGAHGLPLIRNRRTARETWESATFTTFWKDWTVEANLVFFLSLVSQPEGYWSGGMFRDTRSQVQHSTGTHLPLQKNQGAVIMRSKEGV